MSTPICKVGILIATRSEIDPILALLAARLIETTARRPVYQAQRNGVTLLIILTDVGRSNAAASAAWLIREGCEALFNYGTCGSLYTGEHSFMDKCLYFPDGTLLNPTYVVDGDFDLSDFGITSRDPAHCSGMPHPIQLITVSSFPDILPQQEGCLLDMEGYAIVALCDTLDVPVSLWKVITNSGSKDAIALYKNHRQRICQDIAPTVIQKLDAFIIQTQQA